MLSRTSTTILIIPYSTAHSMTTRPTRSSRLSRVRRLLSSLRHSTLQMLHTTVRRRPTVSATASLVVGSTSTATTTSTRTISLLILRKASASSSQEQFVRLLLSSRQRASHASSRCLRTPRLVAHVCASSSLTHGSQERSSRLVSTTRASLWTSE